MVSSEKILLTTSRNPTPRIRTFCNDLATVIPRTVRVNRGKMNTDEVAEKALELHASRVIIVDRWQRGPNSIRFFQLGESGLISIPPVIHAAGIRLRREFGVSKVKPATSLTVQPSWKVMPIVEALSKFFGIPILFMDEAVEVSSTSIVVSVKSNRIVVTFMIEPDHVEVGPRIVVSNVEW